MPQYWSDVFTLETWNEARAHGLSVSGFRASKLSSAKQIRPGDILICYLYGHSRFIGALEATSEAYYAETPRIWQADPFPARVNVRPLVELKPGSGVLVKDVLDQLVMIPVEKRGNWGVYFQGSPRPLNPADGEMILDRLRAAAGSPTVVELPRPSQKAERDLVSPAEQKEAAPREHYQMQAILLRLGKELGMQAWVARGDRGREYEPGKRLEELSTGSIPRLFLGPAQAIVESIDVLWLRNNAPIAAFEVEYSTEVYSGLLRMSDLVALQPYIKLRMFIVAPAAREAKVRREILRPTFSRALETPLAETCGFISFERIRDALGRLGEFVQSLSPDEFLAQLATSYASELADIQAAGESA
jgi:hypothetical protein